MRFVIFFIIAVFAVLPAASSNTWRLENDKSWEPVSSGEQNKFLTAVNDAKKLVDEGRTKAARKAFAAIKKDFQEQAGPDLNSFIKAELLFSQKKLTKSAVTFDKMLTKYPESKLRDEAIERQFEIGSIYLGGRKKVLLGVIRYSGYAEGIKIMEKVTDLAGLKSQIGLDAALAVVKNYEKRKKFDEAYLKWWEVYSQYQTGTIGRDALLGMAKAKHAVYNKNPLNKRPYYDASCLRSARSYYQMFMSRYPKDAEEIGVDEITKEIDEELAYKEYVIGRYYQKTDNPQSANLYFDMVTSDWPDSKAADMAKEKLGNIKE